MSVDDHGLETLKKAAEEITPGDLSEYQYRVRVTESALPDGAATEATQLQVLAAVDELEGFTDDIESKLDAANSSLDEIAASTASIDVSIDVDLSTRASEATLAAINAKIANDFGATSGAVRTAAIPGNVSGIADFNAGTTGAQTPRVTANITRNGTELSYGFGASGVDTQRVAALPGNATGIADFNAGVTGAQTLRTSANITRNGTELDYNQGNASANTPRVILAADWTERATFRFSAEATAIASGKSMISIYNADAAVVIKIREIFITNAQVTANSGVIAEFQLRRFATVHSGGTLITGDSHDTADTIDADVTVRTGATISGEVARNLRRWFWSSDDWEVDKLDTESAEHTASQLVDSYSAQRYTKPLTLRQNEGLHIRQNTASTNGSFDLVIVVTQESA